MIRQLTGTIVGFAPSSVIISVGGVGYRVFVSLPPTDFALEQVITFHTHLAVRETALDLYGFTLLDELEIFELLLTLPKIGPKSALQILTQADITLLKEAVGNEDATYLSKMSGIGKKSAEKIVLGLKDKLADYALAATDFKNRDGSPAGAHTSDTIDALITLGYPASEARRAVQQLPPTIANTNEAVREALKVLSQ